MDLRKGLTFSRSCGPFFPPRFQLTMNFSFLHGRAPLSFGAPPRAYDKPPSRKCSASLVSHSLGAPAKFLPKFPDPYPRPGQIDNGFPVWSFSLPSIRSHVPACSLHEPKTVFFFADISMQSVRSHLPLTTPSFSYTSPFQLDRLPPRPARESVRPP